MVDWRELLMTNVLRILGRLPFNKLFRFKGSTYPFVDYFKGFENVEAVKRIFGEKTEAVLNNLKIEFTWIRSYMWVNGTNGHITISSNYISNGDKTDIYLDLIHELVHVRQFLEGKELFDSNYDYIDRPTEIEAYRHAVEEARRLGFSDEKICRYLKTEWMNNEDLKRLAKKLKITCTQY